MEQPQPPDSNWYASRTMHLLVFARYLFLVAGGAFLLWEASEAFVRGHGVTASALIAVAVVSFAGPAVVWFASKWLAQLAQQARKAHEESLALNQTLLHEIRQVKSAEDQYYGLVESAPDAILMFDHNGRIILANKQTEAMFGYSRDELLGKRPEFLMPERFRCRHPDFVAECCQQPATQRIGSGSDLSGLRKDGSEFPIDIALSSLDTPDGTLVIEAIRDVTERKKADQALREREEQFRAVVEHANDAIAVTRDGTIAYVNQAYLDIYGLKDASEALGRQPGDFALPEYRAIIRERVTARIRGEQVAPILEFPIVRPNGEVRTLQGSGAAIVYSGRPANMAIIRDVTEQKKAEEALEEANDRLRQALERLEQAQKRLVLQERMSALGQMASGVAHDFNNLLTPIIGFSELLLSQPTSTPTANYLERINTAAKDAAELVAHLRDFYRPRQATESFTPVALNDVIQRAVNLTEYRWRIQAQADGRTIRVTTDLAPTPVIHGNVGELTEVVTNLIINAVDAMPEGGAISLSTYNRDEEVVAEVSDTGIGMTEEVRQRCLEPFFTAKGEEGTGLGLSVSYGIVQRHSGSIEIESERGKGTTFRIRLPSAL